MIVRLQKSESDTLENLLVLVNGDEYRSLAKSYIKSMFSDDFRKPIFIIYKKGSVIIGAAAFSEELFTVNTWGISWVGVHPEYRHQGIGQKMVEGCLQEISEQIKIPASAILLTYAGKTRLYEKLGFQGSTKDHEGGLFLSMTVHPYSNNGNL